MSLSSSISKSRKAVGHMRTGASHKAGFAVSCEAPRLMKFQNEGNTQTALQQTWLLDELETKIT